MYSRPSSSTRTLMGPRRRRPALQAAHVPQPQRYLVRQHVLEAGLGQVGVADELLHVLAVLVEELHAVVAQSATYTSPSASTHTPEGRLNWPSPQPDSPIEDRNSPSTVNFCTRSLRQSATYTSPSSSTVTPHGKSNSPSPLPWLPQPPRYSPSLVNFCTRG